MKVRFMVKEIPLTRGMVAIVDDCDYTELAKHRWYAWKGGNAIYARRQFAGENRTQRTIYMHRVILGAKPGQICDHVDGNALDNRRQNLRFCTALQNRCNQKHRQNGTSRFKGVSWHKCVGKWRADIGVNGRHLSLGHFEEEEDAARAYDRAAAIYQGEFVRLNFPCEVKKEAI